MSAETVDLLLAALETTEDDETRYRIREAAQFALLAAEDDDGDDGDDGGAAFEVIRGP
jgi:hypothetical protein